MDTEGYGEAFDFSDEQAEAMGRFVSVLVANGIEYRVKSLIGGWRVLLTGGY
jgi:hypothetical protein